MSDPNTKPRFLQLMDQFLDLLARICVLLAGVAIVFMTAIFAWLVFGRYVLNDTPTWVEQVSLLLVMVIAFLGAAAGVHNHTHLSVVIFRNIVPSWVRTIFVFVSDVLLAGFGAMMFWYGIELTKFKWDTLIPLIQWSEGLRSLPMTISGALLFLFATGHLIRLFMGRDERQDNIDQG
ncbi:TRAP transporter small permease [Sulfitobacter donghicola]|uniref:TRAP transporter small permease protein n=1 Tax=Sulfitobacter donghicola DSW-25 = KCTC 12864 = JCM 14565 TaxID=1300350 RepID=A0A073IJ81_9RHOB|nr:TRAP transporter small permease [Sulfitobacter donghicola]KEJ89834.1 TRAP transporter subunit DctQ [Sulfitobacter donghicola DSW-25 = KCTC 12864 = JCM 14565]KIN67046.1 TRAP transporter subunit DctQ [Sulfitobacter donghicola DSW-25 = KCTC 12864 = JCM 14565]